MFALFPQNVMNGAIERLRRLDRPLPINLYRVGADEAKSIGPPVLISSA